jgi:hypothetical protein
LVTASLSEPVILMLVEPSAPSETLASSVATGNSPWTGIRRSRTGDRVRPAEPEASYLAWAVARLVKRRPPKAPNRFGVVGDELDDEAWRLLDQHPLCA